MMQMTQSTRPGGQEVEMFLSRYMPCEECGESVDTTASTPHRCSPSRRVDFAMFGLRHEIEALESSFHAYLADSRGRFAAWLAARQVRGDS